MVSQGVAQQLGGLAPRRRTHHRAGHLRADPPDGCNAPQFSFGKSHPNFTPTGPWLVTPDEFPGPGNIAIGGSIDSETVQNGLASDRIFVIPRLVAELSKVITPLRGDLLFTGMPQGVGLERTPQRWLALGNHLRSWAGGIGEMNQVFVAERERSDPGPEGGP